MMVWLVLAAAIAANLLMSFVFWPILLILLAAAVEPLVVREE